MIYAAGIALLLAAASLRTRLVRLWLALSLFRISNALYKAASRFLDSGKREGDCHG